MMREFYAQGVVCPDTCADRGGFRFSPPHTPPFEYLLAGKEKYCTTVNRY